MAEVTWTQEAILHLADIIDYMTPIDPQAALRIVQDRRAAAQGLSYFPDRGRPGARGGREFPSVPPYVIDYRVDGQVVLILAVRHGRRLPLVD